MFHIIKCLLFIQDVIWIYGLILLIFFRKKFNREQNSFIIAPEIMYDCSKIKYIEHVKVEMSLSFAKRGSLEMFLKSPHGTQSQIIYARPLDILARQKSYSGLAVTTLHFWGENPTVAPGNWKLAFKSRVFRYGNFQGTVKAIGADLYNTGSGVQ